MDRQSLPLLLRYNAGPDKKIGGCRRVPKSLVIFSSHRELISNSFVGVLDPESSLTSLSPFPSGLSYFSHKTAWWDWAAVQALRSDGSLLPGDATKRWKRMREGLFTGDFDFAYRPPSSPPPQQLVPFSENGLTSPKKCDAELFGVWGGKERGEQKGKH